MADEVFFHLGLAYMELKEYKKAVGAFNIAIAINPQHAPVSIISPQDLMYCFLYNVCIYIINIYIDSIYFTIV